jgi:hypothetical protein
MPMTARMDYPRPKAPGLSTIDKVAVGGIVAAAAAAVYGLLKQ